MLIFLACAPPPDDPGVLPASDAASGTIAVDPEALDFGEVALGETATASLTLWNVGEGTLAGGIALEDPDAGFEVEARVFSLPGGTSWMFPVRWSPPGDGAYATRLLFTSDDPETPVLAVPLSGGGASWDLAARPMALDLGEVAVGCTVEDTVTVTVGGNLGVTLTALGADHPAVAVTPSVALPATLAPGDTFDLAVTVTGDVPGPLDAVVRAASDLDAQDLLPVAAEVVERETETFTYIVPDLAQADILVALEGPAWGGYDRTRENLEAFVLGAVGESRRVAVASASDGCVPGMWVDTATADPERAFDAMLAVAEGDDVAAGFSLIESALSSENLGTGGCNEGFVRGDGPLLIVAVSDTFADGLNPWSYYVSLFQSLVLDPDDLVIHAVAPDYPGGCGDLDAGWGWYEATVATGGLFLSFCATDWSTTLLDALVPVPATGIEMPDWADPDTIELYVDDVPMPEGWIYAVADNAIRFSEGYEPGPGSVVTITYALPCE